MWHVCIIFATKQNNSMKKRFFQFIILLLSVCSCTGRYSTATPDNLKYFVLIADALDNKENYRATFDRKVADLKQKLSETQNTEARYFYHRMLANDYMEFEVDTALSYIHKNIQLAQESRRNDWIADSYILLAKTYNSAGMIYQAREALDEAMLYPMEQETRLNLWMEEMMFWSLRAISLNLPSPDPHTTAFADSIIRHIPDPSSPYHIYAKTWYVTDENEKLALQQELMDYTDQMNPESVWYDFIAECAGIISMANGDTDNQLKYYALSLTSKISKVSRHVPLLADIGGIAMNKGELNYAARFYNATLSIQADHPEYMYNGRGGLARSVMRFHEIVEERLEQQNAQNRQMNYLLAFFILLAIVLLVATMLELRKVRSLHKDLKKSNDELSESEINLRQSIEQLVLKEQQLTDINAELSATNYIKEQYIGSLFSTCSEYINKLDSFRQEINRKIKAGQVEDVLKQTRADNSKTRDEVKELNNKFDSTFLSIYPDFVADFQALLNDEEPLTAPKNGLNTELRIYALVWLGISSSVKIAELLHISPQTVYNARQKIRARSIKPCSTAEEFAAIVQTLGRGKIVES